MSSTLISIFSFLIGVAATFCNGVSYLGPFEGPFHVIKGGVSTVISSSPCKEWSIFRSDSSLNTTALKNKDTILKLYCPFRKGTVSWDWDGLLGVKMDRAWLIVLKTICFCCLGFKFEFLLLQRHWQKGCTFVCYGVNPPANVSEVIGNPLANFL
jgi:hypothetical protein